MTIKSRLEADRERVVKSYQDGKSTISLAKDYGCNPGTIWYFLKSVGVDIKKRSSNYGRKEELKPLVVELHTKGISAYRIAKELGVSKRTIIRYLDALSLSTSHLSTQRDKPLSEHAQDIVDAYIDGESTCDISKKFDCGSSSAWRLLRKNGVKLRPRAIYTSDETYFDIVDTAEKAYMLGWFYSDGNNMKGNLGVRMQITDLEVLEWMKVAFAYTGPILPKGKPKKPSHLQQHGLTINSKKLSLALELLGCPPAKTFLIRFPGHDIVPENLIQHFVRGYFDGDGSFGCHGKARRWRVQIVGTRHLTEGILTASGCHGLFVKRHPESPKDNWTVVIYRKMDLRKFLAWLYADATIFLSRKYDKYQQFLASQTV